MSVVSSYDAGTGARLNRLRYEPFPDSITLYAKLPLSMSYNQIPRKGII
jgi:hypothetical protein